MTTNQAEYKMGCVDGRMNRHEMMSHRTNQAVISGWEAEQVPKSYLEGYFRTTSLASLEALLSACGQDSNWLDILSNAIKYKAARPAKSGHGMTSIHPHFE